MAQKAEVFKVVVLGVDGVGRNSLTLRFTLGAFIEEHDPTLEESHRKQLRIDEKLCMIEIIHLVGMNNSMPMQELCIREGEGYLLVYSVCSRASFEAISELHKRVLSVKGQSADSASTPYPVTVVGNQGDRTTERQVSTKDGENLAKALQCAFVETSARSGSNVERTFLEVVEQLMRLRATPVANEVMAPSRQTSGHRASSLLDSLLPWRARRKRDGSQNKREPARPSKALQVQT